MSNTGTGTVKSRAQLEGVFSKYYKPTEGDFADLFASMRAKEDAVSVNDIQDYDIQQADADNKSYIDDKVANATLQSNGIAKTTDNPGTPSTYQKWDVFESGTFANFLDGNGDAIVVDDTDFENGQVQLVYDTTLGYWQKVIIATGLTNYFDKQDIKDIIGEVTTSTNVYTINEGLCQNVHNYSNFSGFGTPIGIQDEFNRVTIKFLTRATAPTRVDICIKQVDRSGTILVQASKTGLSLAPNTLVSITFDLDNAINDAGQLYLQYVTDQAITDYGIAASGAPFPYPDYASDSYTTGNNLNFGTGWGDDVSHLNQYFALFNVTTNVQPSTDFANQVIAASSDLQDAIAAKDKFSTAFEDGYYESGNTPSFDIGKAVWQDTTSTFACWFFPIGTPQNFNAAKLFVRGKSTNTGNITKVKVWVIQGGKTGTVLATGELTGLAIGALQSEELLIPLSAIVANASLDQLSFAFACDNHVDNYGVSGGTSVPYPSGGVYANAAYSTSTSVDTVNPATFTDVSNPSVSQRNIYVETLTITDGAIPKDGLLGILAEKLRDYDLLSLQDIITADILLPSHLYVAEGIEFNVFFDNVVFSNVDISNLDIDVTCLKGNQLARCWRYTPVAADAGTTPFTITVSCNGVVIASASSTVVIKARSAGTGKSMKVLCIGDSTTAGAEYVTTINTDYVGNPNVTFLGTQGTAPNNVEAIGGRTFYDYGTAGRTYYHFNVSGVTTPPGIGATYTHNGSTYTVREVNMTGGTGYFSAEKTGTNNPLASGTLTKANGTGDATIAFSSYVTESGNVLYNDATGQLDVSNYFTVSSFTMTSSDLVAIHLGINDVFASASATVLSNIKIYFDAIVAAFRAAVPNIRIALCITIPPSISQDAFGENYTTGQTLKGYLSNYVALVKYLLEQYDTADNLSNNIYCVPFNCNLDRTYNMQQTTEVANARTTKTVTKYTNGVHPDDTGYAQMGDSLYSFMLSVV